MSNYADVYLLPIPEENIPAYKKLATVAGKLFLGAMMEGQKPPFDYKRMVYGGFKILVDL